MTTALITREYNGNVFHFREDGYFNMTKAAKVFGKEAKHFWGLPSTVEYLEALQETVGKSDLFETRPGRNGGTWGHPKLAVVFARWLDARFAVFCDMVIDDILNKKAELTITKPAESSAMALPQTYLESLEELVKSLKAQEALKQENALLIEQKTVLQHRVDHLTVRQYETEMGLYLGKVRRARFSSIAKGYCLSAKLEVTKTPMLVNTDKGEVESYANVYPREALEHAALVLGLA